MNVVVSGGINIMDMIRTDSSVQRVVMSLWREKRVIVCIVLYVCRREIPSKPHHVFRASRRIGSSLVAPNPSHWQSVGWMGWHHCFIFQLAKLCQNFSRAS